ncbi:MULTISPECIES: DUF559 domain-containing protein [Subtercola]|uniref:DUF559 domain-containing protein n=1 Tax=Subtercola TaxID=120212 RepID=UPI00191ECAC5|nr:MULTISPECIES: DUF559 domain-containing protein [Subtercola]MEA9983733.1 DUF559 domain-containing protein [Subtercola sp. RTI3]
MVYRRWKVIVEYDGDHHRTDDTQYDRDMLRLERFHLDGWSLLRFRKHALFVTPTLTVARIELALRRAGWTPTPAGRHTRPLAPTQPI